MTISTSSQASAGSLSLFDGTEDVLECSAKSNHSVSESSQNTGRESLSSETSGNSMEPDTEERGFSPEAFLASHSVVPGSERARKMTVSSGLRCVESYGKHNPNGCWQRMFLASLVKTEAWSSRVCLLTWKMQATKRSRLLFRLAALALPTEGIGCGLLQSPKAGEAEGRGEYKDKDKILKRWEKHQPLLCQQIAILPTPNSSMGKTQDQGKNRRSSGKQMEMATVVMDTIGRNRGLKLQPGFVEWMMGYPAEWTALNPSETQSCPKSHLKSSGL